MSPIPIYTIGYGAREVDGFLAALGAQEIAFLIDVRSRPQSRHKPDFGQAALRQHLQDAGIRYLYMGDALGGEQGDYAQRRQQPDYVNGIDRLRRAFAQQQRVALMCAEGKPEQCHRALLIGQTLADAGIPVMHIDENDRLLSQAEVMARLEPLPGRGGGGIPDNPPPPYDDPFDDDFFLPPLEYALPEFDPFELDQSSLPGWEFAGEPPTPSPTAGPPPEPLPLPSLDELRGALKRVFGYDDFRPLQADIIQNVLKGQDTLVIMPTGSGKSLCYQLPALFFPGLTIVVSPLISLMEDQVAQLRDLGIAAVYLNSTLDAGRYRQTVNEVLNGSVKLLYVAPETLLRPGILAMLRQCRIDCLTIDEAHCISEWGHEFRPEYRQLVTVRQMLPHAVCLAVTATATERVRQDITASLGIAAADEFVASFNRENLFLAVQPKTDGLGQTLAFLAAHPDESGIIYCATRRQVDSLTQQLSARGFAVLPYHAGLDDAVRRQHQRQFTYDEAPIMVATIAFGMGINKSNVRFILHFDLPKSLESYYQQIGRAGRDGLHADCLLLYNYGDVKTVQFFLQQQEPAQRQGGQQRLEAMLRFAEAAGCRRPPLLQYFGEMAADDTCEMCDNCRQETSELADLTIPAQKFLACVKRTGEIFGAAHIIDVLRGSRTQRVRQWGHDQLSTYNIGREFSKQEWQQLAHQFLQLGLLTKDIEHGSLQLTSKAYAVFKGEQVQGVMPKREAATSLAPLAEYDADLFALLRQKRQALAQAAGVPPYVVFSDRSLIEMATYFPHSPAAFGALYGVGEAKLARYADEFLPVIREYCRQNNLTERPRPTAAAAPPPATGGRTEEVATLYNAGRSIDDVAALYGIKPGTVLDHLWKYAGSGQPLRRDGLLNLCQLSPQAQQQVLDTFAELGPNYLRPIFDALNGAVSYDDLKILRLVYISR